MTKLFQAEHTKATLGSSLDSQEQEDTVGV